MIRICWFALTAMVIVSSLLALAGNIRVIAHGDLDRELTIGHVIVITLICLYCFEAVALAVHYVG